MFSAATPLEARQLGVRLIGVGLLIVLLAQLVGGLPIAAAMALIAWGVVLVLRSEVSAVVNLLVYAALVGFAIGSQSHAASQSASGRVDLLTSTDHVVALLLLATLTWATLQRLAAAVR